MTRSASRFRQMDVTRALKGAQVAGVEPTRLEIDVSGKIVLAFTELPAPAPEPVETVNPWDEA